MSEQNQGKIDFTVDLNNLYREESYTDLKVASIRKMVPVGPDGTDDQSRTPVFVGSTQLMTPEGPLPIQSQLQANNLTEALEAFPETMKQAMEHVIEQIKQMQEKQKEKNDSRIIVPGQ